MVNKKCDFKESVCNDNKGFNEDINNKNISEDSCEISSETKKNENKTTEENKKYDDLYDSFLHLKADFENYKKRCSKDLSNSLMLYKKKFILSILPIVDDIERSIFFCGSKNITNEASEKQKNKESNENKDIFAILDGLRLIYSKFLNILLYLDVKKIDVKIGDIFDENIHEAISKENVDKKEDSNKIVKVVENGYFLENKVIRFSKVIVSNCSV